MKQKSNFGVVSALKVYSRISGVVAGAVGFIVLCGWIFDITFLKSLHPTLVSMKANTAIAIMLAGMSLWFFHTLRKSSFNALIVSFCAALVAAVGLFTIIEYIGGWNFGIDQLLFKEPIGTVGTFVPGRMALNTALCFLCLGVALLLARSKSTALFVLSQLLSLATALIALIALIGYLYDIREFYGYAQYTQMALHTAFTLLILSAGILCVVSNRGIMAVISGNDFGGFLARRLLPTTIAIPILIGWLRLEGERQEFFGSAFGVFIVALIYIVLFMFLVWKVAQSLNRFDFERKRVEEKNLQLASIIESSDDAIIGKTLNGIITSWNTGAEKMYGYTKEQVIDQSISIITPPDRQDEMMQIIEKLQMGQHVDHFETVRQRKDGRRIDVSVSISLLYDDKGTPIGASTIARDITERNRAEEELRELSHAVEQSPVSIVITDTNGAIEYVNPKFMQLTGYSHEEIIGKNPRILKSGETPAEEYKRLWEIITSGGEWQGEFHNKKKNGELYWESAVISPITNERGVITRFLAVKEDITERKYAEVERDRLIVSLQEALAEIKTLSGLIPICSSCKKIRDDKGYWNILEAYLIEHSGAQFTHGICPECMAKLYPNIKVTKQKSPKDNDT